MPTRYKWLIALTSAIWQAYRLLDTTKRQPKLPPARYRRAAASAVADAFGLALRLAAPFILASVVWQVALGVLSRLVPQLQIYFSAMPGQIIGGLALIGVLSAGMASAWIEAARGSFNTLPGLQ